MSCPKISVVIPVYGVEKYLEKCVNSVLNQTYKNLEIILVDDGSKDNCPNICDHYQALDERVVVYHKKNGGLSDARNYGIERATGAYITFVDSDDFVSDTYIEYLYSLLKEYKADISICDNVKFYEDKELPELHDKDVCVKLFYNMSAMKDSFYQKHIQNSAWCKMYKMELFKDIYYPKGKLYEDLATTYKLLYKAEKIVWSSKKEYYYLQRESSIMNQKFSLRNMDRITVSEEILRFVNAQIPELKKAAVSRVFISNVQVFRELPLTTDDYTDVYNVIMSNIKKYRKIVLFDKEAKLINRCIALMSYAPSVVFQQLGRVYKKIYK